MKLAINITLHYITYITLHYITLHYITLHYMFKRGGIQWQCQSIKAGRSMQVTMSARQVSRHQYSPSS